MNNKKRIILGSVIGLTLILVLGITYAWLTQVLSSTKTNIIKVGGLSLVLDDNASNGINLIDALPQTDSQGLETEAYTFTLNNNGSSNAEYRLILEDEDIEGDRIADSNIKYSLVKNEGEPVTGLLTTTHKTVDDATIRELDSDIIDSSTTNTYSLRLWIDQESSQAEVGNKEFKAKIKLEAVQTENSYEDKYKIEGYLYNDNNELVTNGVIVAYSDPKYSTIDSQGHFAISGLDYGNHTLYYVTGKTVSELKNMNENQIKNLNGVGKVKISTSISVFPIGFNNGYSIKNGSITKAIEQIVGPTMETVVGATHKGIVYLDPTNLNAACDLSNTSVGNGDTGCMKWYIYDDSGDNYKMILDHNAVEGIEWGEPWVYVSYENSNIYNEIQKLVSDKNWLSTLNISIIDIGELARIINFSEEFNIDAPAYCFDLEGGTSCGVPTESISKYAWLYNYLNSCVEYGCEIGTNYDNKKGYWVSNINSVDKTYFNWGFLGSGGLYNAHNNHIRGIRPVITIDKSIIK